MKNKISRRELTLIVIVLLVASLALAYFYYYKPLVEDVAALGREHQQKRLEYEELEERIKQLPSLKKQADDTDKTLREAFQAFYPQLELGEYILKVNAMAKELGIDLEVLNFEKVNTLEEETPNAAAGQAQTPSTVDGLVSAKFQLSFNCSYSQYEKFLDLLDDSERVIIGTAIDMSRQGQGDDLYACTMTIEFLELQGMDEYVTPEEELLPGGVVDRRIDIRNPFIR